MGGKDVVDAAVRVGSPIDGSISRVGLDAVWGGGVRCVVPQVDGVEEVGRLEEFLEREIARLGGGCRKRQRAGGRKRTTDRVKEARAWGRLEVTCEEARGAISGEEGHVFLERVIENGSLLGGRTADTIYGSYPHVPNACAGGGRGVAGGKGEGRRCRGGEGVED